MSHGDTNVVPSGSGASILSVKSLCEKSGYPEWKFKMRMYLMHEDLWSTIEGYGADDNTSISVKKAKEIKAFTKMCLTLHGGAITHVRSCNTAKEVWDTSKCV